LPCSRTRTASTPTRSPTCAAIGCRCAASAPRFPPAERRSRR
jgi:hypothetical protein